MASIAFGGRDACAPRGALARLLVVLVLLGTAGCRDPAAVRDIREPRVAVRSNEWVEALNDGLRVQRAAPGLGPRRGRAFVRVAWTNRTEADYPNSLEIQCLARSPNGRFVSSETANFFPRKRRLMPGFQGELELELPLAGQPFGSVSCSVTDAR